MLGIGPRKTTAETLPPPRIALGFPNPFWRAGRSVSRLGGLLLGRASLVRRRGDSGTNHPAEVGHAQIVNDLVHVIQRNIRMMLAQPMERELPERADAEAPRGFRHLRGVFQIGGTGHGRDRVLHQGEEALVMLLLQRTLRGCAEEHGPRRAKRREPHFAAHQAGFAAINALFAPLKLKADYRVVPWATYV
ncbi:hypothetical protein, partial [uncultured Sphingomonas sp.]|uniref:hypothetical protein n=1 Tax=uncultured Sphingomonas sp. TaxID=158754 RepID=UPI0025E4B74B